ncbi:MAG: YitT family protein [Anaerolineales bacterium]|jgi:uncharacterized membrane-anchored protein YitT (DUF2179 family)|nr:YitT family protein [Anaerolineales bacterium]
MTTWLKSAQFSWGAARDVSLIALGALLQALALRLFLIPANLASGGVSGLAQIINHYTGWPIGVMILLGNAPLFLLGWRYLGGPRFILRTALAVVVVSFFTDFLALILPQHGLTKDLVLNALYGGLISGVGFGLVYRGQGTSGGSDILVRILNHWRNVPISQSYLLTDSAIMFMAGLAFSWENALYALVMLYVSGLAAEAITAGSNVLRTALIITHQPDEVAGRILHEMERGVTVISARGAYTGEERTVLYCVVSRAEIAQIKALVREADPHAFMVIGQAHEALGEGFRPLNG